ncbi:MAG: RnfABCDGE type electron transport complex subunit B [bacterium]|jgi:Na+-translocating ferredoxin:NAD+ oxidoreductase RNF subunit RnfB|nr:RnfABCDGE type electron transport complex subunit B [bacterium]
MDQAVLPALLAMGGLGAVFAGALALADRKLRVEEDPRIALVAAELPGANCGACGLAGCQDFAVKVVAGEKAVTGCPVGGAEVAAEIARVLGVEAGESARLVARVLCRGGEGKAAVKADYRGPSSCAAQALVAGGEKACLHGCLGGADCVVACQFDALVMNEEGLPEVIDALCTGCGVCARACPRDVIELHPEDRELFVFCRSKDDPRTAKKVCAVACLGCGICARKSDGAITVRENLAVIDHERVDPALIPLDKCRTGALGLLHGAPKPPVDAS